MHIVLVIIKADTFVYLLRLCKSPRPIVDTVSQNSRPTAWCDSDAIVLMCSSQAKPQKLSLTRYECKHETKNWKVLLRKAKSYINRYQWHKIVSSSAWKWSIESVMPSDKLSAKNNRPDCFWPIVYPMAWHFPWTTFKLNWTRFCVTDNDCCTIVRLSSDVIVRWDYRPNPSYTSKTDCKAALKCGGTCDCRWLRRRASRRRRERWRKPRMWSLSHRQRYSCAICSHSTWSLQRRIRPSSSRCRWTSSERSLRSDATTRHAADVAMTSYCHVICVTCCWCCWGWWVMMMMIMATYFCRL